MDVVLFSPASPATAPTTVIVASVSGTPGVGKVISTSPLPSDLAVRTTRTFGAFGAFEAGSSYSSVAVRLALRNGRWVTGFPAYTRTLSGLPGMTGSVRA